MARVIFPLLFAVVSLSAYNRAAAQANPKPQAKPAAGKKLNVYMYSEYIDPELLKQFTAQTGIEPRISVYEAEEEMMAKMQGGGGASQYDVVVLTDYLIPVMAKLNLIQPLAPAKIPNRANVNDMFVNPSYDPGNKYGMPYQWGTVGLFYRTDKAPQFEPSWDMVFDEAKQPGSFVLMDEMRSMMGVTLVHLGYAVNTRNADEARKAGGALLKAKHSKKCLGFDGGVAGVNKVVSGDAVMAVVFNGDAVKAMKENKDVRYVTPKEGTTLWVDCMVIPAKAPNAEGAHKFINFILDAKNGAQLSNFNHYATPNKASLPLIAPEDRADKAIYPSDEDLKKMKYVEDLGKDTALYDDVWTQVKSR